MHYILNRQLLFQTDDSAAGRLTVPAGKQKQNNLSVSQISQKAATTIHEMVIQPQQDLLG